jgi:hydrogenase maturation protease
MARHTIQTGRAMKTIVLGMGNPILCDDAVGIRLARDLRRQAKERPGVDFIVDCSVGGLNLLDLVTGYDRLIVFDSTWGGGGSPGTWYSMTGWSFRETMNLTNVHDANFTTALELGRQMGARVPAPEDVHIFAIEIADNTSFSERMTPELERAYPEYSQAVIELALRLLGD